MATTESILGYRSKGQATVRDGILVEGDIDGQPPSKPRFVYWCQICSNQLLPHWRLLGMANSTLNHQTMELGNSFFGAPQDVVGHYASRLLLTIVSLVVIAIFTTRIRASGQPPSLSDPIPFIFNTAQFVYGNEKFMNRVR